MISKSDRSPALIWSKRGSFVQLDMMNRINFVHRLKTIRKNGKAVGVVAAVSAKHLERSIELLYYPLLIHIEKFEQSVRSTMVGGPARNFPGSVGSVRMEYAKPDLITVHYLQAHFKTPPFKNLKNKEGFLPRSIATKYGGWREHLIQTVFDIAKETKATIQFDDYNEVKEEDLDFKRSIRNRDDLITKMSLRNGYRIHQDINSKGATYKVLIAEPI